MFWLVRARESIRLKLDVHDRKAGLVTSTQWKGSRRDGSEALLGMAHQAPVLMQQVAGHRTVAGLMGKLLQASQGKRRS